MTRFRSIATLLISRIVWLALICMSVFVGALAWWEYRAGQQSFRLDMRQHARSSQLQLSSALWDIEPQIVRQRVAWLASLPQVGYVRVRSATTGEVFEAGDMDATDASEREPRIKLDIPVPGQTENEVQVGRPLGVLGTLEIWESRSHYAQLMRNSIFGVVLGYVLFTILVCAVVAIVMRRQLRDPLRQISHFARSLRPNELSRPLVLQRPQRNSFDEIDLVASGFAQLQKALQSHIADLDSLVAERTAQLELMVEEVKRLSLTDALTGCYNRRALDERLATEIERSKRYGRALSVVFMDLDHFKRINDEYGHVTGDAVLREVALRSQGQLRSHVDWMARYGGEEFLLVLPECAMQDAWQLAERLLCEIRSKALNLDGLHISVTASFGVAELQSGESMEALLERADAAMYQAKHSGRARVCLAKPQAGDVELA
ncbi:diguanylate cyclase [Comamonas sp.]|uniref:sensor domain-containing diguanylate cyclase n=1 Tax=Comamonas sp. TaxID=34028 RepID=UPI003A953880